MTADDPAHRATGRLANVKPTLGFPYFFHLIVNAQSSNDLGAIRWFGPQDEFSYCHIIIWFAELLLLNIVEAFRQGPRPAPSRGCGC